MSVFQFKKFSIRQEKSAMKVGTDGVVLGAWAAVENKKRALDIGTGTGLVSLMLAQRNPSLTIDAIEMDKAAFDEASFNVIHSGFSRQINLHHSSFEAYKPHAKYDLIVTNPPYHFNKTPPSNPTRKLARHGTSHWMDWIEKLPGMLSSAGEIALISPFHNFEPIKDRMQTHNLYPKALTYIRPKPNKSYHRVLQSYSHSNSDILEERELVIELEERHHYSPEYQNLLKEFLIIF